MKLTEKYLKKIISEEIQKAISGSLNVAEYDVEKSVKQLVELIDAEAEKFDQKYQESGDVTYDVYNTKLYSISENLEYFLKRLKSEGPYGLMG